MGLEARTTEERYEVRLLTQQELEHRILSVAEEVFAGIPSGARARVMGPRWISAADLVRRMKPFMVYN